MKARQIDANGTPVQVEGKEVIRDFTEKHWANLMKMKPVSWEAIPTDEAAKSARTQEKPKEDEKQKTEKADKA